MLPEDVDAAAAAVLEGGWGDRHAALRFYARHASTDPLVAEDDGKPVGTAVAIQHGAVGWVGLVFVAPALRGRGLGAELTRAALDQLRRRGCETALDRKSVV